jgi:hypothetical protein
MTIEAALLAAVAALTGVVSILSGAVVTLFLWFRGQFNLILAKLQECEEDREDLWNRLTGGKPPKKPRVE